MKERNGVRVGQRVRDLEGKSLGRVKHVYDWGFDASKGFPILFRSDYVFRYDEVRGMRDGALVIARTDRDLIELAEGEMPASWRIPAPPGFPGVATPPEAHAVFAGLAAARAAGTAARAQPLEPAPSTAAPVESTLWRAEDGELGAGEERRYAERRGQGSDAAPPVQP
ncbi:MULTISPECIES: hypothetical protein [Anaeromyxobacter]|uniref:hypothetical protein n=1 Tax=Anaeromyxobacter TaxID=161492 RepID=UPI001F5681B5|nr:MULTISPECIES: hypothetical protein [unclassified Anaeromyxobacter]